MNNVLCFGELLLRFSPASNAGWIREQHMPVFIGGAELNVATALAKWNMPVTYLTALPDNYLSKDIIDELTAKRIDTSKIIYRGHRIGSYYLAHDADLKHASVIYDRAGSSFATLGTGTIDWDQLFKDIDWFHFSAITPALNPLSAALCREALIEASKRSLTVSVDLNFREKLWKYGKSPLEIMPDLVHHCHIIMGNIWSIEKMLGIRMSANKFDNDASFLEQSSRTSAELVKQFPGCRQVLNTFRFDSGTVIRYFASLFQDGITYTSKTFESDQVIDRIGTGDACMAGLIYSNLNKFDPERTIGFAAAAAFTKLFIKGDATNISLEEIIKMIEHE